MKISISKAKQVYWMSAYNEDKQEVGSAVAIGGNNHGTKEEQNRMFTQVANGYRRPQVQNRFVHIKIAVSPQDDNLSNRTFNKIGEQVLERLGYTNVPFKIYRHYDTAHPHIHIIASRIRFDNSLVRDSFEGLKCRAIERELEAEFELTPNADRLLSAKGIRKPGYTERWQLKEQEALLKDWTKKGLSPEEIQVKLQSNKRGQSTHRRYVINSIVESMADRPTLKVFLSRLERRGVRMIRHEFERNQKTYYGVSYKVDPSLIKTSFLSNELDGRFSGMNLDEAHGKEKIKHPFYGVIDANYRLSPLGKPELCLYDTLPVEQMKPMSFRASNLGPYFSMDSLKSNLTLINPALLNEITIKRTSGKREKGSSTQYPKLTLTAKEDTDTSSILVAAECRSASRVREVLARGYDLAKLRTQAGAFSAEEEDFIIKQKEVLNTRKQVGPMAMKLSNPLDAHTEYRLLTGEVPNTATREILSLVDQQNWAGIALTLKRAEAQYDIKEMPNPALSKLSALPRELTLPFFDYQAIYRSLENAEGIDEAENKRRAKERELAQALEQGNEVKAERLLEEGARVREIPRALVMQIKNEKVKQRYLQAYLAEEKLSIPMRR